MISGTYQFWAITEPIECGFHAFDMGTIYIKPKYTFFIVFNYSKLCCFNCQSFLYLLHMLLNHIVSWNTVFALYSGRRRYIAF